MNKILNRILKGSGTPDLINFLANNLSPTDLQSLLLEVYNRRIKKLYPADVFHQYIENRFVKPSLIKGEIYTAFDEMAFRLLPNGFETIELSPLAPLGSCSAIAPVNQNNIVTTIRNTEVCSDNTNVMAMECVQRRRQKPKKIVKLCSSFRVLRAQMFSEPAAFAHFRVFSLCTSGRDTGNFRFEIESVSEHIQYYLNLIEYSKKKRFQVGRICVVISAFDTGNLSIIEQEIINPLIEKNSQIHFKIDQNRTEARGYYLSVAFRIYVSDKAGEQFLIVDGGLTDWTQLWLSSNKERLLISGFGSERFILCFGYKNSSKSGKQQE